MFRHVFTVLVTRVYNCTNDRALYCHCVSVSCIMPNIGTDQNILRRVRHYVRGVNTVTLLAPIQPADNLLRLNENIKTNDSTIVLLQ